MTSILYLATFAVGLVLALHFSMSAAIGDTVKNVRMSNAIFWVIGAITAVLISVSGYDSKVWAKTTTVPPWLYLAGAVGACIVFSVTALIPRLGAATTNVILLSGQVIGAMLIAHFGLLQTPVEPINPVRIFGVLVMILGATVVVLGRIPLLP